MFPESCKETREERKKVTIQGLQVLAILIDRLVNQLMHQGYKSIDYSVVNVCVCVFALNWPTTTSVITKPMPVLDSEAVIELCSSHLKSTVLFLSHCCCCC